MKGIFFYLILGIVFLSWPVSAAWYTFDDCGDVSTVGSWNNPNSEYDGLAPTECTTIKKQGGTSMNLSWNTAQGTYHTARWTYTASSLDFSAYQNGYMKFWIYLPDTAHFGDGANYLLFIAVGSAEWSDRVYNYETLAHKVSGWNEITLDFDTDTTQGTPDWTAIDFINLIIYENSSNPINSFVLVDDFRIYADDPVVLTDTANYYEVNTDHYRTRVWKSGDWIQNLWQNHDRHDLTGTGTKSIYNSEYLNMETKYSVTASSATYGTTTTALDYNSSELVVITRSIYENFTNISMSLVFIPNQPYFIAKEKRKNDATEPQGNAQSYFYINDGLFGSSWPYGIHLSRYNGSVEHPAAADEKNYPFSAAITSKQSSSWPMWYAHNSALNVSIGAYFTGMSDDAWLTSSLYCCAHGSGFTEPQFNWYGMEDERHFTFLNGTERWLETYIFVDEGDISNKYANESFNPEYFDNITAPDIYSVAPFNHSWPGSGIDLTTNSLFLAGRYSYFEIWSPTHGKRDTPIRRGYLGLRFKNDGVDDYIGGGSGVYSIAPFNYGKNSTHSWANQTWERYNLNVTWHMEAEKDSNIVSIKQTVRPTANVNMTGLYTYLYVHASYGTLIDINNSITDIRYSDELFREEGYTVIYDSAYAYRTFGGTTRYWYIMRNTTGQIVTPSDSWTVNMRVYPHDGNITAYSEIESANQRVHYFSKYAKTMPGLINDSFGQITDQNVIIYNATYNTSHLNLKAYSIADVTQTAYIYTNISNVKYILADDGIYRIWDRWGISITTGASTEEIEMPWGTWNTTIPRVTSITNSVNIYTADYNPTTKRITVNFSADPGGFSIENAKHKQAWLYGIGCDKAFSNAKIIKETTGTCNYLVVVKGTDITIIDTSTTSKPIPRAYVIAAGAVATLAALIAGFVKRRRKR